MSIVFRKLKRGDRKQAVGLVAETMDVRRQIDFERSYNGKDRVRWGLFAADGKLFGLTGFYRENREYWLSYFAVAPCMQNHGWGRWLLWWTEQQIKAYGSSEHLYVETYKHYLSANEFYKANGYQECGSLDMIQSGGDHIIYYRKNLNGNSSGGSGAPVEGAAHRR